MVNTTLILIVAAVFGLLVGIRALKLGRHPWAWGIIAFLFSPLLVWIVLEIAGRKEAESQVDTSVAYENDEKVSDTIKAIAGY